MWDTGKLITRAGRAGRAGRAVPLGRTDSRLRSMTARALLISGAGRYADPWHPFARTSAAVADIVNEAGFAVDIAADVDDALARLAESALDLLMLNIGDPAGPLPEDAVADA